eukprot:8126795-Pyramimonas_sp.AAC.1
MSGNSAVRGPKGDLAVLGGLRKVICSSLARVLGGRTAWNMADPSGTLQPLGGCQVQSCHRFRGSGADAAPSATPLSQAGPRYP